jgi:hypothetical protein
MTPSCKRPSDLAAKHLNVLLIALSHTWAKSESSRSLNALGCLRLATTFSRQKYANTSKVVIHLGVTL